MRNIVLFLETVAGQITQTGGKRTGLSRDTDLQTSHVPSKNRVCLIVTDAPCASISERQWGAGHPAGADRRVTDGLPKFQVRSRSIRL